MTYSLKKGDIVVDGCYLHFATASITFLLLHFG